MKQVIKEYLVIFITLCFCLIYCTGFYSQQYIDDIALVIAMGIEEGEKNILKLSVQIALPSKEVGSSGESGGSSENSTKVLSVECTSIDSGINILNTFISKRINLSHCKAFVFSESIAKKGISEYVYGLINQSQVRPDSNIIISKCSAEYFLKNSKPSLDELSAKYYETAPSSSEYTAYTENIKLMDFFAAINDSFRQPHAILGSVSSNNANSSANSNSSSSYNQYSSNENDSNYVAGQTPVTDGTGIENVGLAVFVDDTLVGELNAIETVCHSIISNKLQTSIISISDPFDTNSTIDLFVKFKNKTKRKVSIVNGSPYIECDVSLNSKILSMNESSKYLDENQLKTISSHVNSYLEYQLESYLYKTAKDFKSDIDNFGKNIVSEFLTINDWEKFDWLNQYQNSFFKVSVDCKVNSGFLLLEV